MDKIKLLHSLHDEIQQNAVVKNTSSNKEDSNFSELVVEPLLHGFGHTMGNSLRRIMLTSIPGFAVVAVSIEGVGHEFAVMEDSIEDVMEILLNFKEVAITLNDKTEDVLEIKTTSNKLVAGDLEINSGVTVHNPELVIANFNSSAERNFKVFIGSGIGHVSDDGYEPRMVLPEGFIKIAASFSPVSRVSYSVEEKTNLNASGGKKQDSLKLNLDTDGSMEGVEVVRMAATIMQSNLELIAHASSHTEVKSNDCVETEQDKALKKKITELNISVRSLNCLKSADIETLGDLISFPERHLLKLPNFGKVSLKEIKEILTKYNIVLNK